MALSSTRRRSARAVRRRVLGRALAVRAVGAMLVAGPLLGACAQRKVVVGTGGAATTSATSLQFTNNLAQTVNVYLRGPDGNEVFLRQVAARSTEVVPVRGVREGASVQLRIAPVDGAANITRENVVLGRETPVRVP